MLLGKTEEQKHSQRGGVLMMVHSETGVGGGTLSCALQQQVMFNDKGIMEKVSSITCF